MSVDANTIKAIFLAALEKTTAAERAAYLDEACAQDPSVRQRVETLLQAHDRPDSLLDLPATKHLAVEDDPSALDFLEPSARPGSPGRLGHYHVLEVLGRGGMGVVLRAFDEKLHRVVALKVLTPALASNAAARKRFVREARAAAAVTHQNVIAIHGVEDTGRAPYLVMQCIDGPTLQEKLNTSGPLGLSETLRIGLQIAEGLAAAHRQGLIHRDIKPANILLENGIERVKITDFGLARTVDDASLTQSGYIAGTPLYMSPEQARGEPLDHRSDLFSLGSVLYALCTGYPPFQAPNSMAVLKQVCEDTPRPLREINPAVPDWLETLITRLHAKNPANRFAAASEVAAVLSQHLARLQSGVDSADPQLPAGPAASGHPARSLLSKPSRLLGWAGLGLLALAVAFAGWWWQQQRSPGPTPAGDGHETAPPGSMPAQPVVLKPSRTLPQHTNGVHALAFSRDGKVLASGGLDQNIYLWDTATWQVRGPLRGHPGDVTDLAFSPDNSRLASVTSAGDTCLVRLWDVATARAAGTLGGPSDGQWAVAFSPDGKTLACGGRDKDLHLLDAATGAQRLLLPGVDPSYVRALSFAPDGGRIATGGSGPPRLWDTTTGQEVATSVPIPDGYCPVFLPGGQGLAGWNHGLGRILLCQLPSGQIREQWPAHPEIMGLAVSPDGRFLASIGQDGVARVWSSADKTEVATLNGHQGAILAAAFTPDGARLATGGKDDFSTYLWDLPAVCRVAR
jgi:serine/threonine protein kinase